MRNECRSSYRLSLNAYPTGVQGFFGSLAGCWCRSSSRGEGYDNYRFENLGSAHPRSVASSSSSSAVSAGHCLRCRRGPSEPQGTARGGLLGPWLPGFGSMRRRRIGAGSLGSMIRHGRNRFNCDAARRPVQWRCLSHFASHCERSAGAFAGSPAQAGGAPYAHCDAAYRAWVPCPLHRRSRRSRQQFLCARYGRGSRAPFWAVGGFGSLGGWTRPQSPQACSPVTRVRQGAEARRRWGIRQPRRLDPSARYVAQMISLPGGQLSACGSAPKRLH